MQPERSSLFRRRNSECLAVPPAAAIRAVVGHRQIGEVLADGVRRAGNLAQVQAVVRLLDFSGGDLRGEHRRWNGDGGPALWMKCWRGDCRCVSLELAGGLESPALAKRGIAGVGCNG